MESKENIAVFPSETPDGAKAEDITYRALPHNYEAEQALLGALLVNNNNFERISELLLPEHFMEPAHGRVFGAVKKLIERGQVANPVTLKTFFDQDEALESVGGARYLSELAAASLQTINLEDYSRLLYDLYLKRQLVDVGEGIVNTAYDQNLDLPGMRQIEEAEKQLFELATHGEYEGGFQDFARALTTAIEVAEAAYKRDGQLSGIATGLTDLDKLLGGLHNSDLIILAARPSMGKTALATNVAFNAARRFRAHANDPKKAEDGGIVGFFSLEMSAEQLATRILAEASGIPSEKIRRGELSQDDFNKVVRVSHELSRAPFYIDDTPALTVSGLRTRARRLKRQKGLSLIIVDYLQLMQGSAAGGGESRVQEISAITRGLKMIAKELDVPVIALSQLSRAVENREDKRPQLSDLRESGSIEQDADVVMFIFREEYYLGRAEPLRRSDEAEDKFHQRYAAWQDRLQQSQNKAEVLIAKQRHGPIGKVVLRFEGATTKFDNLIQDEALPYNAS